MHGIDDEPVADAGPVYDRIKTRLLAQMPPPMQLLQISMLADELGTSTTPVREALTRLAAERVIVYLPKKGFFGKTLSEEELRGLYFVNQTLLQSALRKNDDDHQGRIRADPAANADSPSPLYGSVQQVHLTAQLFLRIAMQSGISELTEIVSNINDRLHHARLVEQQLIADAPAELSQLQGLYNTGAVGEVQKAISSYHDRRAQLLPLIYKELLYRPYSTPGRKQESRG